MPDYVRGDLVWVPFPFSSDADYKVRPAVVLTSWRYFNGTDYLVCLVTTQQEQAPYVLPLKTTDMAEGKLSATCYIRPTYTFAVDGVFIKRRLGKLSAEKTKEVVTLLVDVLNASQEE